VFGFLCGEQLVAGSGANQDRDESPDAAPLVDSDAAQDVVHADVNAKEDGYSVGVPGPLTRIFVIANRGVANLIQDLILVSFPARSILRSVCLSAITVRVRRLSPGR